MSFIYLVLKYPAYKAVYALALIIQAQLVLVPDLFYKKKSYQQEHVQSCA